MPCVSAIQVVPRPMAAANVNAKTIPKSSRTLEIQSDAGHPDAAKLLAGSVARRCAVGLCCRSLVTLSEAALRVGRLARLARACRQRTSGIIHHALHPKQSFGATPGQDCGPASFGGDAFLFLACIGNDCASVP